MIHIGKIIEEEMRRQERTPAWLARKINCARPNVYYIFKQESVNTDLLLRISQALEHLQNRYLRIRSGCPYEHLCIISILKSIITIHVLICGLYYFMFNLQL